MTAEINSEMSPIVQLQGQNTLNRRSLSIFSRKGSETPPPAVSNLALSGVNMAFGTTTASSASPGSLGKAKGKRWSLSGRCDMKIPEGTILRAVPKDAPKTVMTPLEREMAISPNEEILRAIGAAPESAPASPLSFTMASPLADNSNTSPRRYYSKREKRGQQDILGVWRNGRVQWGKENVITEEEVGRPRTADSRTLQLDKASPEIRTEKPKIQVIIPDNMSSRRPFNFMPYFSQYSSDRLSTTLQPIVSPPSVTPTGSLDITSQISAMSPPIIKQPIAYKPFQPLTLTIDESPVFVGGLVADRPAHSRSISNSSNSDSENEDNVSLSRSSRSSMTSIGVHNEENANTKDDSRSRRSSSDSAISSHKRESLEQQMSSASQPVELETSSGVEMPRLVDLVGVMRTPSTERRPVGDRKKRLSSRRGHKILARINSQEKLAVEPAKSPSLDQAMYNLEDSLSKFSYVDAANAPELVETSMSPIPAIVLSPVDVPPPPPRKSSKRRARLSASPPVRTPTMTPAFSAAVEATRIAQCKKRQMLHERRQLAYSKVRRMSSVRSVLSLVLEDEELQPVVDSQSAEDVIFHILSRLGSLKDLFSFAVITKGFYSVFKRHELELMSTMLRTQCPAAWELRESVHIGNHDDDSLYSVGSSRDYASASYFRGYKGEMEVVLSMKKLILQHCPSLLRGETIPELHKPVSSRIDAALYRVWTFCQIFGANKGREDDIVAQMDWLRGGILAHQESCTSNISIHDSFHVSSVFLSAPEHFAMGNAGGLSAEELYDILEMWNCLSKMTSGIVGQTQQARQFGVFDETEIHGGDIDGEEAMLEEWHFYILSLGLAPILDIATALITTDSHSAFASARHKGITLWKPPFAGTSRSTFLHEAVSRLYEERICEAFSPEPVQMREMRSIRRAQDNKFQQRRLSVRSLHYLERTPSREWGSFRSVSGPASSSSFAATPSPPMPSRSAPSAPSLRPSHTISRKALPTRASSSYFPRNEPIAEELPSYDVDRERKTGYFATHPLQRASVDEAAGPSDDPGQNSSEKAIARILEMGFSLDEAKGALKITDMGEGLRVDRAVEYLLRSKGMM